MLAYFVHFAVGSLYTPPETGGLDTGKHCYHGWYAITVAHSGHRIQIVESAAQYLIVEQINMSAAELRKSEVVAHLLDALSKGEGIGHYGRLVFVMVARHFLTLWSGLKIHNGIPARCSRLVLAVGSPDSSNLPSVAAHNTHQAASNDSE